MKVNEENNICRRHHHQPMSKTTLDLDNIYLISRKFIVTSFTTAEFRGEKRTAFSLELLKTRMKQQQKKNTEISDLVRAFKRTANHMLNVHFKQHVGKMSLSVLFDIEWISIW